MNDQSLQTIEQVRQFLEGSDGIEFRGLEEIGFVAKKGSALWAPPSCLVARSVERET